MISFVFLPISAATLAIAAVGGDSAAPPEARDPAKPPPAIATAKTCRSTITHAAPSLDDGVWRRHDVKTAPLFLWAVDRRIDGCEVMVPVGQPDRAVPLPVVPAPGDAGDLLHDARAAAALQPS
jgi:hypothetical protein